MRATATWPKRILRNPQDSPAAATASAAGLASPVVEIQLGSECAEAVQSEVAIGPVG